MWFDTVGLVPFGNWGLQLASRQPHVLVVQLNSAPAMSDGCCSCDGCTSLFTIYIFDSASITQPVGIIQAWSINRRIPT